MSTSRVAQIEAELRRELSPQSVEVIDESHLHVGHAGARDGKGHFRVHIVSDRFEGLTPIARHRLVFTALQRLMQSDIHALSIQAATPTESSPL